jgi:hypothetical protein
MQKNHGDFKSEVRIHLSIKVTKLGAIYSNIKRMQLTLQQWRSAIGAKHSKCLLYFFKFKKRPSSFSSFKFKKTD